LLIRLGEGRKIIVRNGNGFTRLCTQAIEFPLRQYDKTLPCQFDTLQVDHFVLLLLRRLSVVVKTIAVSNLFDDDFAIDYSKLNSIIACTKPKVAGQIATERLRTTYVRPICESCQQLHDSRKNSRRQCRELRSNFRL